MRNITVKQTSIIIDDYKRGDAPLIERFFSLFDQSTHTYQDLGMKIDDVNRTLTIPRGIDVKFVERVIGGHVDFNTTPDPYTENKDIYIKYLPRDDKQKEAIRFILGVEQYAINKVRPQLSINLDTSVGKTYVTIACVAYLKARALVIASRQDWLNQWKERITEHTDIKEKEILFIRGSSMIMKILSGKINPLDYKFCLMGHGTIEAFASTHGWDKIAELFILLQIEYKIYDEAHTDFRNMINIDFHTNTCKTLYVTATPNRSSEGEDTIYKLYLKNVPSIDLFDPDTDPRTHYVSIRYRSLPSPTDYMKCIKSKYGLDRNYYVKYLGQNENFYNMLRVVLGICAKYPGKILMYIATRETIARVKEFIQNEYPYYADQVGVFTSDYDSTAKKDMLNKRFILSTTKSFGACMDENEITVTVVLAEPFKSAVLAKQSLGRNRQRGTYYIEIVDDSFPKITEWYNSKKPLFRKYALSCKEIVVPNKELLERAKQMLLYEEKRVMYRLR